jgi:excisionase family DNA binding protein
MSEQLYSADEAAQILGLQVRTVRSYLREGRLPGVRIGKQYRIARSDLEAFTGAGLPLADAEPTSVAALPPARPTLEVSSVVQVDGIAPNAADRITRTLAAATAGRPDSESQLRVEPVYDEARRRLKVIIVGAAVDTVELIRVVEALLPPGA